MVLPSPESVAALLLAYWQGEGPEDRSARNCCRMLAGQLLPCLPPNVARSIPRGAPRYAAEIREALADLMRCDPKARALAESLSPPEHATAARPVPGSRRAYLSQLRQILAERFDLGELRTLCFDLGIDYDDLPGEGKANKARELVAYLNRHDRIPELLRAGEQLRPDISWSDTL